MSRRSDTRITTNIPVRIWGMDASGKPFNEDHVTADVSLVGARIVGLKSRLHQGDIVGMQCATGKGRFRVTRSHESVGVSEVSLCCVEPGKCIWDPKLFDEPEPAPLLEPVGSRRKSVRYLCPGVAEALPRGGGLALWCKLADISYSGCYLETPSPLPPGTKVQLNITIGEMNIGCEAAVKTSHNTVGMGLSFLDMGDEDADKLGRLINHLAGTEDGVAEGELELPPAWIDKMATCQAALRSMREMMERGEVPLQPRLSNDIERLAHAFQELRERVVARVTNQSGDKQS